MTNIQKWVAALRSGRYKQGSGRLRCGDKFCCLGVACDLYAQEHPEAQWHSNGKFGPNSEGAMLPDYIARWLGIRRLYRLIEGNLASMNDNGKTFEEIADYIEGNNV